MVNYYNFNWFDFDEFKTAAPTNWSTFGGTNISIKSYLPQSSAAQPWTVNSGVTFSNNLLRVDTTSVNVSNWTKGSVVISDAKLVNNPPLNFVNNYLYSAFTYAIQVVPQSTLFTTLGVSSFTNPYCNNNGSFNYQMTMTNNARTFLTVDLILTSATLLDTITNTSTSSTTGIVIHASNVSGLLRIVSPVSYTRYTINFLVIDKLSEAKQTFSYTIMCYGISSLKLQMTSSNIDTKYFPTLNFNNSSGNMWIFESNVTYKINVLKNNSGLSLDTNDLANFDLY
jgi:hypothetical protein